MNELKSFSKGSDSPNQLSHHFVPYHSTLPLLHFIPYDNKLCIKLLLPTRATDQSLK